MTWQKGAAIAGVAAGILFIGDRFGLLGGVDGGSGSSKKGTVTTGVAGVTPEEWGTVPTAAISQEPAISQKPAINLFEQLASALQLTNLQLYPQSSGEMKYSGNRETETKKKYIEGDLRTDLFGSMKLNPTTLQLYSTEGLSPGLKLYTEKSRDISPAPITKKEIAVASTPESAGPGQLWGNQSGYGGIKAGGGSAGASGSRPGGTGSWTSSGYTTRY